jgi:UDP-3-O-[3-hydroxymyristoyl] glucosamine N-acyltransferase
MADPRFYDNRGPFTLAEVCAVVGADMPQGTDPAAPVRDLASLEGAGPDHLTFCTGTKAALRELAATSAGICLIGADKAPADAPAAVLIAVQDPALAFAAAAEHFYPDGDLALWAPQTAVDPTATIGEDVALGPGVVVGPGAEIGEGTRIGPNAVIGRGVAIGCGSEIGANVTITHAYIGDCVLILPGAQIGQPGFGFASGPTGHRRIPQLGRVIVQDRVEVGACSTIDRGALGDTVIGEGTKIDNLVQIGHNCRVGRHCMLTGQVGMAGSAELGDFVIVGGQTAIGDHTKIGDGARFAGRSAVAPGDYAGGQDYGGYPARPIAQWRREVAALAILARRRKRDK